MVEFERINFLTGVNGSGKSTLIDALQMLLLGDTVGSFFNKAANEKSRRNLKGYLRGEIAENEENGLVYLRNGNFSSYVVGEFLDTVKEKTFCFGLVFDCVASGDYQHRFFVLESSLPDHHFIHQQVPYSMDALKKVLYETYGRQKVEFYDSNQRYREVFRGKMGNLNERFFQLFKKSVPFSPIMDIKGFISEFVCDIRGEIEISDMVENIRYYRQLEREQLLVQKRIEDLQEIAQCYQAYEAQKQEVQLHQYLINRIFFAQVTEKIKAREREIMDVITKKENVKKDLCLLEQSLDDLDRLKDDLIVHRSTSEVWSKAYHLKEEKDRLQDQMEVLKKNRWRLENTLVQAATSWKELGQECLAAGEQESLPLGDVTAAVDCLQNMSAPGGVLDGEALRGISNTMHHVRQQCMSAHAKYKEERLGIRHRMNQLEQEIKNLSQGVKPYSKQLVGFIEIVTKEIEQNHGIKVAPEVFADTIEVRDEKWRHAVEGYLYSQKFHLLIDPSYFQTALAVYERLKFKHEFYDLGLVDVGKVMARAPKAMAGSLAEEIMPAHEQARVYTALLLGRVMKCERVEDLRQYDTAITPSGMLYQRFVVRQINPKRYRQPYIGRCAVAEQLKTKQHEMKMLQEKASMLQFRCQLYEKWSKIPGISDNDIHNLLEWSASLAQWSYYEQRLAACVKTYGQLDLSNVMQMKEQLTQVMEQQKSLQEQKVIMIQEQSKLESRLEVLQESLEDLQKQGQQKQGELENQYAQKWRHDVGEPCYREIEAEQNDIAMEQQKALLEHVVMLARNQRDQLLQLRGNYNHAYKASLDILQEHQQDWEKEQKRLEETTLSAYGERIQRAREKAQRQFQEDFISKLRENIETVERQLLELNLALRDIPFGKDRYHFSITPNKQYQRYYHMIMSNMLLQGYNVFSEEFQNKYQDVVNDLFNRVVAGEQDEMSSERYREMERDLAHFTDFRTYLEFDLIVVDEQGNESRLSRIISKKSGGETQTPFYISVLASFVQIYRVKQQGFNNTLRLIVFDEAYSKMDHQRIKESINLVRDLDLQLLISAPTEKIADIAPLVDRNLCITRLKSESFVKAFDPQRMKSPATI